MALTDEFRAAAVTDSDDEEPMVHKAVSDGALHGPLDRRLLGLLHRQARTDGSPAEFGVPRCNTFDPFEDEELSPGSSPSAAAPHKLGGDASRPRGGSGGSCSTAAEGGSECSEPSGAGDCGLLADQLPVTMDPLPSCSVGSSFAVQPAAGVLLSGMQAQCVMMVPIATVQQPLFQLQPHPLQQQQQQQQLLVQQQMQVQQQLQVQQQQQLQPQQQPTLPPHVQLVQPCMAAAAMQLYPAAATAAAPQAEPEVSAGLGADGVARLRWAVDARRFTSRSEAVVSPAMVVDVPGLGRATFKLIARASQDTAAEVGRTNFRASNGRGVLGLKCDSLPKREPATFTVTVDRRNGEPLGLNLQSRSEEPWQVKSIGPGLIQRWNTQRAGTEVQAGDSLLEVNGVRGELAAVRQACGARSLLTLTFRRDCGSLSTPLVQVCLGVGSPPSMLGPVAHDFGERTCCRIDGERRWNFHGAADATSKKVLVCCDLYRI